MRIQETLVTDKQIALELCSENGKYRLPIEGKNYYFPTLEKVHEAFLNQNTYDTIKLTYEGKKSYLHLFMDEIEVFDTKKALRQRLSQDSQGMWAEVRNGQKHYYVEQRGWISSSYKEITEQECLEKLQYTSTMTKALGIGLGILALLPGAVEFARHLPVGTKEAAMGLIALNQKSPLLGAVGYSLLPSKVEAQALGTEFQVNTYTTGYQALPSIAPLNDGGFVVIWQSSFIETTPWSTPTSMGQDGDGAGIFGQRYDGNGSPTGPEFQVNTFTTNNQLSPSIASQNDGGFVVIWESDGQDGDSYGIYGQRYDSNGMVSGTEFQINTYTTSPQRYPSVASLNDGSIVVTWYSNGQDGASYGIFGQRYDSSGAPAGSEFQVNTYTTSSQDSPSIAPLNDGGFVIIWESFGQDGDGFGIYGQRYDSNGVEAGTEFQVNSYTTSFQTIPCVASLNNGGFVVTWQSDGQDGDFYGIFGQRYESSGTSIGGEFQVNTYTTGTQSSPSVAPLNDGGFVVAWESYLQDGGSGGIFGQRYDSNGSSVGTEFQVNTYTTSDQNSPSVAPLNDGGFIVAWRSNQQDGDSGGIFGQRFDASGNPIKLQLPITTIISKSTQLTTSPNTSTPFLPTTESGLTAQTAIPSNTPSPTSAPTRSMLGPTTVSSLEPTSNILPIVTSQSSLISSTTASRSKPSPTLTMSGTSSTSSMTSAAPGSNTQAAVSTQSNRLVTSTSPGTIPISSTPVIGSVENIVYEESYPILVNDQVVGTYTISGGNGSLDSGNLNVIYFEFDPSFQPEEGEVITLFYIPDEEVALWESIEIAGESIECLEPHGNIDTKLEGSSYQVIFEEATCLNIGSMMLATVLPLTLN